MAAPKKVAPQEEAPLAVTDELDSLFEAASGEGFENTTSDDIQLPRLVILQPTSPEVSEDSETYHVGDLINSVSKENYGKEFTYYPVFYYKTRTQWESREIGSPIVCRSQDSLVGSVKDNAHGGGVCSQCPQSKFSEATGKNGEKISEPPLCTQFSNLILFPADGVGGPVVYSAKRSALQSFKVMLNQAMTLKRKNVSVALYYGKWKITSEKVSKNKQTYFVPKFEFMGLVDKADVALALKTMNAQMKENQSKLRIDEPPAEDYTETPVHETIDEDEVPY